MDRRQAPISYRSEGIEGELHDLSLPTGHNESFRRRAELRSCCGKNIVRGSCGTRHGHLVIIPQSLFTAMQKRTSDNGGKAKIEQSGWDVVLVEIGDAALRDVDTLDAVVSAGGVVHA